MTAPERRGRALLGACVALAVGAALLWGASAAVWYRVTPAGRSAVTLDGGSVHPWLTGLALLALAGIAGLVALAGIARRAVAVLLGLAGLGAAGAAVFDLLVPDVPPTTLFRLPSGMSAEALRGTPGVTTAAPLLAVAGGLVMVGAAAFVLVREPRLARFGARYAAPGARPAPADPDRAAWAALDEGRDPTAHESGAGHGPGPGRVDPDDGRRDGAV